MAKPWKPGSYNRPDTPKGQGAEGTEKGAEAAEKEMGETGFMGKSPPPPEGGDRGKRAKIPMKAEWRLSRTKRKGM